MGQMRNTWKIVVGRRGRKKKFGKPKYMWEDNIKMVLKGM
jgi:hypothetical protein